MGIGEVAMHQAHRHSTIDLSQDVTAPLQPDTEIDPEVCASDMVDFSPVYRCLHIFSVLVHTALLKLNVLYHMYTALVYQSHALYTLNLPPFYYIMLQLLYTASVVG